MRRDTDGWGVWRLVGVVAMVVNLLAATPSRATLIQVWGYGADAYAVATSYDNLFNPHPLIENFEGLTEPTANTMGGLDSGISIVGSPSPHAPVLNVGTGSDASAGANGDGYNVTPTGGSDTHGSLYDPTPAHVYDATNGGRFLSVSNSGGFGQGNEVSFEIGFNFGTPNVGSAIWGAFFTGVTTETDIKVSLQFTDASISNRDYELRGPQDDDEPIFFGVYDSAGASLGIKTVKVGINAHQVETFGLDDMRYLDGTIGTLEIVPEPGTLALLATGLAGIVARRRRRKAA